MRCPQSMVLFGVLWPCWRKTLLEIGFESLETRTIMSPISRLCARCSRREPSVLCSCHHARCCPAMVGSHSSVTIKPCNLFLLQACLVSVFNHSSRKTMTNLALFVSSEVCFFGFQINSVFSQPPCVCTEFLPLDSLSATLNQDPPPPKDFILTLA